MLAEQLLEEDCENFEQRCDVKGGIDVIDTRVGHSHFTFQLEKIQSFCDPRKEVMRFYSTT